MERQYAITNLNGIKLYSGFGARAYVLSLERGEHDIVVSFNNNDNLYYANGIIPYDRMADFLTHDNGMYEVIPEYAVRNVYFDIESYASKFSLPKCTELISSVLPGATYNISGSYDNGKHSYHIVVVNYTLTGVNGCNGIREFCKLYRDYGFDHAVYTKNRLMKCINQSKQRVNPARTPQQYVSGSTNLLDHLITLIKYLNPVNASILFDEAFGIVVPRNPIGRGLQRYLGDRWHLLLKKKPIRENGKMLVRLNNNNNRNDYVNITRTEFATMCRQNIGMHEMIPDKFRVFVVTTKPTSDAIEILNSTLGNDIIYSHSTIGDYNIIISNNAHVSDKERMISYAQHNGFESDAYVSLLCVGQEDMIKAKFSGVARIQLDEPFHGLVSRIDPKSIDVSQKLCVGFNISLTGNVYRQQNMRLPGHIRNVLSSEPLVLLGIFPVEHDEFVWDHQLSVKVALWLMSESQPFESFWGWRQLKDIRTGRDSYERWRNSWIVMYNTIHLAGNNKVTRQHIIRLLERFYPDIRKEYLTRVYLDNTDVTPSKDIGRQFLQHDDISKNLVTYLATPMGSGKTNAVCDWIKRRRWESMVIINVRVSLAQNIVGRLPATFVHYNNMSMLKSKYPYEDPPDRRTLKRVATPLCDHLVTTPNSLHYVGDRRYDVVIIDEIEMFHTAFISGDTHKGKLIENFNTLCRLLTSATKIILMDALPSNVTFRFLKQLGITDIEVVGSTFQYHVTPIYRYDFESFLNHMVRKLRDNKKIYVFWPYKTQSTSKEVDMKRMTQNQLHDYLEKCCERSIDAYIYNSDTCKQIGTLESLRNATESWRDKQLIIVNQSVTIGVNFELPDCFDSVFIADALFVNLRELCQTSRRIRHLTSNEMFYTRIGGQSKCAYDISAMAQHKVLETYVRDVVNERLVRDDAVLVDMFRRNFMNFETGTIILSTLIEQTIAVDTTYDWDCIEPLTDDEFITYERRCMSGIETLDDILRVAKYRIQHQFHYLQYDDQEEIWKQRDVVDKIMQRLPWVERLFEEFDDCESLIPDACTNHPLVLSDDLRDDLLNMNIIGDMNPRNLTAAKLVGLCLNSVFGRFIYSFKPKPATWMMDERFVSLYNLCTHESRKRQRPGV